jgi:hypothetical protein
VISLTTIPPRIARLHLCIESLFRQTLKPDRIVLWLNSKQFAGADSIPRRLRLQQQRGLEIRFCDTTWPHKKLLYSLEDHPDAVIVTSDDDFLHRRSWLRDLWESHLADPSLIVCHRARLISFTETEDLAPYNTWPLESSRMVVPSDLVFPTGAGGVLYPPRSLHRHVLDFDLAKRLCPTNDDIWFKAMAVRQGTRCRALTPSWRRAHEIRGSQATALWQTNLTRKENDTQLRDVMEHFDLMPRLRRAAHRGEST